MNTIDGLRMSYVAAKLMKAQNDAAEFELDLQEFIHLRKISTVPDVVPRLNSMADSFEAVAKSIRQIATELKGTDNENA